MKLPAAVIAVVFVLVVLWEMFATNLQPTATLSGWDASVHPAQPAGWSTTVKPETLWQKGFHWCSLNGVGGDVG